METRKAKPPVARFRSERARLENELGTYLRDVRESDRTDELLKLAMENDRAA